MGGPDCPVRWCDVWSYAWCPQAAEQNGVCLVFPMLLDFAGARKDYFSPSSCYRCQGFFSLSSEALAVAAADVGQFDWGVPLLVLGLQPRGSGLEGLALLLRFWPITLSGIRKGFYLGVKLVWTVGVLPTSVAGGLGWVGHGPLPWVSRLNFNNP